MALPMQPAAAQAATVPAMPTAPWPAATTPTNRGGYAAPASETINTDDFYLNMEQIPPPRLPPQSGCGVDTGRAADHSSAELGDGAAAAPRVGAGPAQRPADELGVEESEFDKPTYLRRGLYAPE